MIAAHSAPAPAYTVKPGDTLSQIAQDDLGDAGKWPSIWHANPGIKNPNLIYAGEKIKVSDLKATAVTATSVMVTGPASQYAPKHAKTAASSVTTTAESGNMVQIADYLEAHGGTKAAAAGVAACIWGESQGNPESVGSGGFGLIGWTGNNIGLPGGYFMPDGNPLSDMDIQLAGVVGYIDANGGWGSVNDAGGPVAAAQAFSAQFEKPAVMYSDIHYGGAGDPAAIYDAM